MRQQTNEQTVDNEKKLIRELLKLDESTEIAFSDFGWTSRVYIINSGEIVFKFPREEKVKEEYKLEISAYKLAHEVRGGVLIPEIQWEHPNYDYLGYRGVVGESLDKVIATLSATEKAEIGTELGTFLRKFHQHNIEDAPEMTQDKEFDEYKYKLELGLPDIEKYFAETEVAKIKELILEKYPQKMRELGFKKGLCHGDLGYWNMIHAKNGKVGIIDFGDVGHYDTSIDFAGMNDTEMLDAALAAYGDDIAREKIAMRMKIIPVLDLPFFVGKQDQSGIERTIERIRKVVLEEK